MDVTNAAAPPWRRRHRPCPWVRRCSRTADQERRAVKFPFESFVNCSGLDHLDPASDGPLVPSGITSRTRLNNHYSDRAAWVGYAALSEIASPGAGVS